MADPIFITLLKANCPEDIFGRLGGDRDQMLGSVKKTFRELALATHPDTHKEPEAKEAFERLHVLRDAAVAAVADGTYGQRKNAGTRAGAVVVESRKHKYTIAGAPKLLDLADLFPARCEDLSRAVLLKVASGPEDNDLLSSEAEMLRYLRMADRSEAQGFWPMLPELVETFDLNQAGITRRVNVFGKAQGFFTLEQVHAAYPAGLDPKHLAWIFRQLLLVLGYVHARGVVHGAVLPNHVLIHPAHDLMLVDFSAALRDPRASGSYVPVMSNEYADYYPPEVMRKESPTPGTDIAMAAHSMRHLLANRQVNPRLGGFLAACELPSPTRRPQDAWQTREEFTRLIEKLWGPRRRIPFTIPNK